MKTLIFKSLLIVGILGMSQQAFSQCEILNKVSSDGSMQYYMEPVNFYWTEAKSLKGCIVTDKENYFLALRPIPFPEKGEGKKLKNDLELKLSNDTVYKFSHYDTRYSERDTVMEMLFLIGRKDIDKLLNLEVEEASIDMEGTEGVRVYGFVLHKAALKEQLACFLKEKENKKK